MSNLLFISVNWLTLTLFVVFVFENVKSINEGGVAYLFLALVVALSSLTFFGRFCSSAKIAFKKSLFILSGFFMYVVLQVVVNLGTLEELKSYTVGTTRGIVFSYILGLLISVVFYDLNLRASQNKLSNKINFLFATLFFIIVSFLLAEITLTFKGSLRVDIFLILEQLGMYQRPGGLMCMYFMVISFLSILLCTLYYKKESVLNRILLITIIVLYIVNAGMLMILGQMIGSNKTFVVVFVFMLLTLTCVRIISKGKYRALMNDSRPILCLRNFWKINKMLFYSGVLVAFCVYGIFHVAIKVLEFDISKLRIINFGLKHELLSVSVYSRIDLLKYFPIHFNYNPLFGNINVDALTTGSGSYAHSLMLSLISHTGLIGFFLFIIYIYFVFRELLSARLKNLHRNFYFTSNYINVFRVLGLMCIIIMATASAFFTWMPLWFALGLFSHNIIFDSTRKMPNSSLPVSLSGN